MSESTTLPAELLDWASEQESQGERHTDEAGRGYRRVAAGEP